MPPKVVVTKIEEDLNHLIPRKLKDTIPAEKAIIEEVESYFDEGTLSKDWELVAIGKIEDNCRFFCLDWTLVRLSQAARDPEKAVRTLTPGAPEHETTDIHTNDFIRVLNQNQKHQLVTCANVNDADAVALTWSADHDGAYVGHVQVKYDGKWESKPSTSFNVITHGRDDFAHFIAGDPKEPRMKVSKAYKWAE